MKPAKQKFIVLPITPKMLEATNIRAASLAQKKANDPNSNRNGEGVVLGFLAEEVIKHIIGPTAIPSSGRDVYNYDLFINGKRHEIKAKEVSETPKSTEECSIYASNTRQECDYYVFVRILKEKDEETNEYVYTKAYICGFIEKPNFFVKARLIKKGTLGTNIVRRTGKLYVYPSDVYNMYICDLPYQYLRKKKNDSIS